MTKTSLTESGPLERTMGALSGVGRVIYSLAIIALGIETIVCAGVVAHPLGKQYELIPALPWVPAIRWVAYLFGAIWVVCGAGLLVRKTERRAALTLGTVLFLCGLVLDLPKAIPFPADIGLRTIVFETLVIASLAWLLPYRGASPNWLTKVARYVVAVSLIVFGVDHFLGLTFIAAIVPGWIPFHKFWVAFFGVGLIAAGVSIGLNLLQRWGAACGGLMFGIWVVTLHIPRVMGLYGIPGAPRDPDEYSSLLIAIALWGGLWALTGGERE